MKLSSQNKYRLSFLTIVLAGGFAFWALLTAKPQRISMAEGTVLTTPEFHILVRPGDFRPDLHLIDVKYRNAMRCLGYNEEQTFLFSQVLSVDIVSNHSFECGIQDKLCLGDSHPEEGRVEVTENLVALAHELVHIYHKTGHDFPEINRCGECIDFAVAFNAGKKNRYILYECTPIEETITVDMR